MNAQQLNLDVIANNLANVSTTGFKKSRADFQDLMYQIMRVPGSQSSIDTESPTGIQIGLGVRPAAVQKLFTQGDLIQTGNELDVAIEGSGFYQIELPNGETAYTRAGAFKRDGDGRMTTSDGYPIVPGITIPDGSKQITISETGVVSAIIGDDTTSTEIGDLKQSPLLIMVGFWPSVEIFSEKQKHRETHRPVLQEMMVMAFFCRVFLKVQTLILWKKWPP